MLQDIPIPHDTVKDYNLWKGDWELIGGYPYALSPSALPKHQLLSSRFVSFFMMPFSDKKPCCDCNILFETDWIVSDDTVMRPDIMIVCGTFDENDFIRIPPVLMIEISSSSTRLKERNIKYTIYQQQGVKYYLMADPDGKTIKAFELRNNQHTQMSLPAQFELHKNCSVRLAEEQIFAA